MTYHYYFNPKRSAKGGRFGGAFTRGLAQMTVVGPSFKRAQRVSDAEALRSDTVQIGAELRHVVQTFKQSRSKDAL